MCVFHIDIHFQIAYLLTDKERFALIWSGAKVVKLGSREGRAIKVLIMNFCAQLLLQWHGMTFSSCQLSPVIQTFP